MLPLILLQFEEVLFTPRRVRIELKISFQPCLQAWNVIFWWCLFSDQELLAFFSLMMFSMSLVHSVMGRVQHNRNGIRIWAALVWHCYQPVQTIIPVCYVKLKGYHKKVKDNWLTKGKKTYIFRLKTECRAAHAVFL